MIFQRYPAITAIVCIAVLAGAAVVIYRSTRSFEPTTGSHPVWLYDEQTGEAIVGDSSDDGPRAAVFACGSCDRPADRFVGFLTDEQGRVRDVESEAWHHGLSPEADEIAARPRERCQREGKPLKRCEPEA